VLLIAAVVALGWQNRRSELAQELAYDLQLKGGQAYLPQSLLDGVRDWWGTVVWNRRAGTIVLLGPEVDGEWLRRHDDLAGLSIVQIDIYGDRVDADAIRRLVELHPVSTLGTLWRTDTDAVAEALSTKGSLRKVFLNQSDLTDAGFRRLPLEQLEELGIDETYVTAEALDELHKCSHLEVLALNPTQLTESVVEDSSGA
jgi:hypothetical protein